MIPNAASRDDADTKDCNLACPLNASYTVLHPTLELRIDAASVAGLAGGAVGAADASLVEDAAGEASRATENKRRHWVVVGNAPLDDSLLNPPPRFIQDALRKDLFRIYEKGQFSPATKEECIGLEREAVWDPTHAEDRLRDHYAGRKNKWVESLKIRR
jgi:hypothetical protein